MPLCIRTVYRKPKGQLRCKSGPHAPHLAQSQHCCVCQPAAQLSVRNARVLDLQSVGPKQLCTICTGRAPASNVQQHTPGKACVLPATA